MKRTQNYQRNLFHRNISHLINRVTSLATIVAVATTISSISPVNAAIDCNSNCYENCALVAPGSTAYCKSSCNEYCAQDDRHDGLSGSVDATDGETGIFGGSIDGTVTRGQDRPPLGINIIPKSMLDMKALMINNGVKR